MVPLGMWRRTASRTTETIRPGRMIRSGVPRTETAAPPTPSTVGDHRPVPAASPPPERLSRDVGQDTVRTPALADKRPRPRRPPPRRPARGTAEPRTGGPGAAGVLPLPPLASTAAGPELGQTRRRSRTHPQLASNSIPGEHIRIRCNLPLVNHRYSARLRLKKPGVTGIARPHWTGHPEPSAPRQARDGALLQAACTRLIASHPRHTSHRPSRLPAVPLPGADLASP